MPVGFFLAWGWGGHEKPKSVNDDHHQAWNACLILVFITATEPTRARFSSLTSVKELQDILLLIQEGERDVPGCRPHKVLQNFRDLAKQKPWDKPFSIDVFAIEPPAVLMLSW
jgi:hypothetical protein